MGNKRLGHAATKSSERNDALVETLVSVRKTATAFRHADVMRPAHLRESGRELLVGDVLFVGEGGRSLLADADEATVRSGASHHASARCALQHRQQFKRRHR